MRDTGGHVMNRRSLEWMNLATKHAKAWPAATLSRWLPRAILVLVFIAATAAFVTIALERPQPAAAQVPLTQGIISGGTSPGDDIMFNDRVRRLVRIGSSDRQMGRILSSQGFRRSDWSSSPADEHSAVREEVSADCDRGYYVYWRSNDAGNVTEIRGEYSAACR